MNTKLKEINMLNDAMFKSIIRSKEARPVANTFLHFLTHIEMDKLETAIYMGKEIKKSHINEKGKISDVIIKIEIYELPKLLKIIFILPHYIFFLVYS